MGQELTPCFSYMTGPKADAILAREGDPTMKKKRKKVKNEDYIGGAAVKDDTAGGGGLKMQDEDEWKLKSGEDVDMEGADAPGELVFLLLSVKYVAELTSPVIGADVATFKKSKSQWSTVGGSAIPLESSSNQAEAGPSSPRNEVKEEPDAETSAPPIKKRKGGLKTAAQLRAEVEAAKAARSPSPQAPEEAENRTKTVHRDASGRIVDVEKLKAEEKARENEEKRKELEREEWSKGMVQRQQREERVREERDMANRDVGR